MAGSGFALISTATSAFACSLCIGGILNSFQLGHIPDMYVQTTGDFGHLLWVCCAKPAPRCCLMSCVRHADEFV